jgi:anaerobic dimethyl sulfoxide reductase subunit A
VACNRDCGGGCPLLATVEDGRVVRIANNPAGGPFLKGCVRGYRAMLQQQAPDRLTVPLVRTGPRGSGQFRDASWDEALERVAEGLEAVREKHGNGVILAVGGSGSCRGALHNTAELTARFLNLIGGHVGESSSYSSATTSFVEPVLLGTRKAGVDPATLQHSEMIVLWGANIVACIMGCEWRARVRQAKRRGVPVVVVDPRRTETAKQLGTDWLPLRPGTDCALMLGVLYVLITEDLVDEAFVVAHATGFEALRRRVLGLGGGEAATPEWAEQVCGTPAARIVALAREWARRRPTALVPGLSIQRTVGGEEAVRLAIALQTATGNLGRLGGSSGGRTWNGLPGPRFDGIPVPPNPVDADVPANDWADAILRGRAGGYPTDIRAVYIVGGNYVAQGADVHKSVRAMQALEFSVCHDLFLTSTARHSDVVLPVTHWLERNDVVFTTANYLLFSHKVAEPPGQARDDYEVFADLAERMGCGDPLTEGKNEHAWLREFIERSEIPDEDEFRAAGIYVAPDQERVGLATFADDPERYPLTTSSGKVELAGAACIAAGLSEVPEARVLPPDDALPLRLVTPKSRYRVHSQLGDIPWFRERDDRSLWMHPRDASARGIRDGAPVLVTSAQGKVRCACRVTDDILPGVVSLCEGIEPEFDEVGCDVAGAANVLTSDEPTLPSRGATMHSSLVQVESDDVDRTA